MNLNRLVRAFNSYKLSKYQKRFEKLKANFHSFTFFDKSLQNYWKKRQLKYFGDLEALMKQVSKLGDIGQVLESEIRVFIGETRKKVNEQGIQRGEFMKSIYNRGQVNYPAEMPHVSKRKEGYRPGDEF
jgi:hypothetical protein